MVFGEKDKLRQGPQKIRDQRHRHQINIYTVNHNYIKEG